MSLMCPAVFVQLLVCLGGVIACFVDAFSHRGLCDMYCGVNVAGMHACVLVE